MRMNAAEGQSSCPHAEMAEPAVEYLGKDSRALLPKPDFGLLCGHHQSLQAEPQAVGCGWQEPGGHHCVTPISVMFSQGAQAYTYRPIRSFSLGGRMQATQKRTQVEQGPTSPSQRIFRRLHLSHALDTDLLRGRQRCGWHDDEGASPTVARRSSGRLLAPSSEALPGSSGLFMDASCVAMAQKLASINAMR